MKKRTQRDSFIVRIWREEGQPGWRGWVQHVRTGESIPVQSAEEIWAFIERRIGNKRANPDRKGLG